MALSRRDFVATSVFGAAGLYASTGLCGSDLGAQAALAREDGYKLWLRYAPPPAAAQARYREAVRQVVVEGTSSTADIVRREVGLAIASLVGTAVPTGSPLTDHAVVIGTPKNSAAIR